MPRPFGGAAVQVLSSEKGFPVDGALFNPVHGFLKTARILCLEPTLRFVLALFNNVEEVLLHHDLLIQTGS